MAKLAKPRKSKWRPSAEIIGPRRPSHRFVNAIIVKDDGDVVVTRRYELCDTKRQCKLVDVANALLAQVGFFLAEEWDEVAVDADAIGTHGQLVPTWQGRA